MHGDAIEEISVFSRSILVIWLCKNVYFSIFYIILEEGK